MHALSTLLRRVCLVTALACIPTFSLSAQQPGSASPGERRQGPGDANWAFYRRAFASINAGEDATTVSQGVMAAKPGAVTGFTLEDTRWTYDDGDLKMEGILMKPDGQGPFPAILISHGRGGNAAGFGTQKAQEFVKMGFVCIAPDYTHAGRGNGGLAGGGAPGASPENLKRAAKCLDILQSLPYVDSNRLAAYGNSMGAFITVSLSASEAGRLKATAITAGGVRMRDGAPTVPAGDIPRVPMCILHGGADGTVPPDSSASLKELLDKNHTPNERHVFDGIGHNLHQQKADEVFGLMKAWFVKHGVLRSG